MNREECKKVVDAAYGRAVARLMDAYFDCVVAAESESGTECEDRLRKGLKRAKRARRAAEEACETD